MKLNLFVAIVVGYVVGRLVGRWLPGDTDVMLEADDYLRDLSFPRSAP